MTSKSGAFTGDYVLESREEFKTEGCLHLTLHDPDSVGPSGALRVLQASRWFCMQPQF